MMAALSTVLMLTGYFPYLTYTIPCIASLPIMVSLIEFNKKSAFGAYAASVLPVFLLCEPEAKFLYLLFIGYYPVLKSIFEGFKNRIAEYTLKLLCFNSAVAIIYFAAKYLSGISYSELGSFGKYGVPVFILLANTAFLAYDICLTKMSVFYLLRFHKPISKIINKK